MTEFVSTEMIAPTQLQDVDEMTEDAMLRELVRNQREILSLVKTVTEQVEPTLDALKSSAIGKMFGM
jgi:N-acetylmuramic acid 6-phosphate (MurNAc-6-P) etherase